jgi:hypothetical protein
MDAEESQDDLLAVPDPSEARNSQFVEGAHGRT